MCVTPAVFASPNATYKLNASPLQALSASAQHMTQDIVRFQSMRLYSMAAVLTALVIKSVRLLKDTG